MFIKKDYIENLLASAKGTSNQEMGRILDKAEQFKGLNHAEIAALLTNENPIYRKRIFEIAGKIKRHIYGNRIVMFAPLYVSDYCVNKCAYCSYNTGHTFRRRKLMMSEIQEEVKILEKMGHKRIALEAGEDDAECPIEYILECIHTIYEMKFGNGEIRRVNVNIAATTEKNYQKLKDAGIGTYILFQETYHQPTYEKVHIAGPKKDYEFHLTAFDRAMKAGVEDVGGGVLFGLSDPYFEVLGLMLHNEHLEERFGVGFHTISVPRLCKATGTDMNLFSPQFVDDATFEKIVAVLRLAVPYTGIILSTRENHDMRAKLLQIGISQLSAGSRAEVGGYAMQENHMQMNPQFEVNDERDAISIISELIDDDYIPSFCTACYRSGRTGDRFMSLAKSGNIGNVCLPNALMTLCEYSMDYGDLDFKEKASAMIQKEIAGIHNDMIRIRTQQSVDKIRSGERDFFI